LHVTNIRIIHTTLSLLPSLATLRDPMPRAKALGDYEVNSMRYMQLPIPVITCSILMCREGALLLMR